MLTSILRLFGIALSLTLPLLASAQNGEYTFGKVDTEELTMSAYEKDPQAQALYLCEKRTVNYQTDFTMTIDVFVRIKIFSKEAVDLADVAVPYISDTDKRESVNKIEANTYNLVNGKMVKTPLSKKNIFTEKLNEYASVIKFSLPEVREGSVIEYKYRIRTRSFSRISEFNIQHTNPVKHSEIDVYLPDFIGFTVNSRGLHHVNLTTDYSNSRFSLGGGLTYPIQVLSCHNDDIPALHKEPMVWCINDFIMGFDLEVNKFVIPEAGIYENYSWDWNGVNATIRESDLGRYQNAKNPFSSEVKEIREKDLSDTEKMREVLDLVRNSISFNGARRLIPAAPSQVLHKGTGDMADLNNILSLALEDCGFRTDLILLNPRSEGRLSYFPSLDKIRTFIVRAYDSEGNKYYMDASDKYSDLNVLSPELLVDKARVYDPNGIGAWANLSSLTKSFDRNILSATIDEDGVISGTYTGTHTNQEAYDFSQDYKDCESEDKFIEGLESSFEMDLDSCSFSGIGTTKVSVSSRFSTTPEIAGDYIYIRPTLISILDENPFSAQTRELPIEFDITQTTLIQCNITVPEGYSVEEMPAALVLTAGNGDIKFSFLNEVKYGHILTRVTYSINRLIYSTDEYEGLSQFYGKIAELANSRIVLKKNDL